MWIEAFWIWLQNIFLLFETMCYQFFHKESTLFTPKNMLLEGILATSLANSEEDSLYGDSFVGLSRFDAYALPDCVGAIRVNCKGHDLHSRRVHVPSIISVFWKAICRWRHTRYSLLHRLFSELCVNASADEQYALLNYSLVSMSMGNCKICGIV